MSRFRVDEGDVLWPDGVDLSVDSGVVSAREVFDVDVCCLNGRGVAVVCCCRRKASRSLLNVGEVASGFTGSGNELWRCPGWPQRKHLPV